MRQQAMAELMALWTVVLVALFPSDTLANWKAHEATVELLPNDIVPHQPVASVITSPQQVIKGQVESMVDTIRQSLEEVRQSMNPKGKRNIGEEMPPLYHLLLLIFTVVSKLNQMKSLANSQRIPNPSLAAANVLTGVMPPAVTHTVHATVGNPADLGEKLGLVKSPNAVDSIMPGTSSSGNIPVVASVVEVGSKVPAVAAAAALPAAPAVVPAAPAVVAGGSSLLPVGLANPLGKPARGGLL